MPPARTAPPRAKKNLLLVAGAAAATSATTYALSVQSRAVFMNDSTPADELDGLRTRTNTLAVSSGVTAATAIGTAAAGMLVKGRF